MVFWSNVVHIGVAALPVAWLCFTLQFAGYDHLVDRWTVAGLSIVPVVYLGFVFTNEHHQLVRKIDGIEPAESGSFHVLVHSLGPVFDAHALYGHVLLFAGVVVLFRLLFWSPAVYRRQVALLVLGAFTVGASNVINLLGRNPIPGVDTTPFSFPIAGALILVAIYHYRLLDLTPVARTFVLDTLQEGVLVLDTDDRVVDVNESAARLLEVDGDDAIGRPFDSLVSTSVSPSGRGGDGTENEIVLESAHGRRILHLTSTPVSDVTGDSLGRSIVCRDVTETRELRAEIDATLERLRRSNAELESFAGVVSHDLRGPLRTVEDYLSMFERRNGETLDEEDAELVAIARENAQRGQAMVTDLLQYATIETDGTAFGPVDCNRVIADVLESLRFEIEERNATIDVGALPTVVGVDHLLRRLFQNLLTNALEYAGDDPPAISVTAVGNGGAWAFAVRDTGVGIDPGSRERVFDLFTRADRTENRDGTGMGLAICKKIVDVHDGTIDIDSSPGGDDRHVLDPGSATCRL